LTAAALTSSVVSSEAIDLLNCRVRYQRQGSGPTLLFLHGAGGVPGWTPWMARLAERYDVIVPDHPGFGASDTPAWFDNIHDLAYYYLDFIAALGLHDVHLVGHSLGGWIAAEVAVRTTAALRTLTLVSAAGLRIPGVERVDVFLLAPDDVPRVLYHDQAFADALLANAKTDAQVDLELKNSYSFARVAWQPRLYDPHLEKWLHRIDVPTLLVWGDADRLVPPAHAAEFKRLIPHATVELIRGCGHVPQVEGAETFLGAVNAFIARNAA
jgi:pimeloyl-ACP methyl ester carboxylesterase